MKTMVLARLQNLCRRCERFSCAANFCHEMALGRTEFEFYDVFHGAESS